MEIVIVDDPVAGAATVAREIASLLTQSPSATIGLATGSSPEDVYAELARLHVDEALNCRGLRGFLLDEYIGLPLGHPASYRSVIQRQLVDPLELDDKQVRGPDAGSADLMAACLQYEDEIASSGGIDLQLLGLGTDGHIAFNEPGSSLGSRTRIKTLALQTRMDNARFFGGDLGQVPHHAITQGVGTILEARHIILVAWGARKAEAIAKCVEGPITARVPGSAVQLHPHVTVVIDSDAASELEMSEYYRSAFAGKPVWQPL